MNDTDRNILRDYAKRQMEYSMSFENQDKIRRWYRHNSMKREPMVLAETFGIYREINLESKLRCEDETARSIELNFLRNFFLHEYIKDDSVIDPYYKIQWDIKESDNGFDIRINRSSDSDGGEWGMEIDPPIKDLENDLPRLKHRTYEVNSDSTKSNMEFLEDIFGDILPVKIYGDYWWTMGLSHHAIYLTGLENFMMYMYDQPDALHELMGFIYRDRLAQVRWMEEEKLLNMNNGNNYIGSGSRGFTDELVQNGPCVSSGDMWALLESQPTSHVSPEMFREFVFKYQLDMAASFGWIYYGCCEPLHDRMDIITTIPNLRSVSVSPYSDERIMADHIGNKYIYSRKPDPVLLSTGSFDAQAVRDNVARTMDIAGDCELEFIMKDLHTVRFEPNRLSEWVRITKETIINRMK